MLQLYLTIVFAVAVHWVPVSSVDCHTFDSHMGATFDLKELIRTPDEPVYTVEDGDIPCTTGKIEQNYTYYFNICGAAVGSGVPRACSSVPQVGLAGALQVDQRATANPSDDWCYISGKYDDQTTLGLIDANDPTKGIQMTYYGDICSSTHTNRQFIIQLSCQDKLNPIPLHAYEYQHCVYTVSMPSVYGCPLECPVASRKLCGGNGHCGYDADKRGARCFCNHGFSGSDCMTTATTAQALNYSPALLGLIITIFVLIGILVGVMIMLIKQMATIKEDISNYQVLKSGEEESTTV